MNIEKQKDIINTLSKCKPCVRKAILNKADKKLVSAICEIVDNFLHGNLSINKTVLPKLKKYKHTFRKLVTKSNFKNKKKLLVQRGGFLEFLIPAVITGISSIVSSLISNHKSDS